MRGRNRSSKGPNPLTRSYESNGPDVKIRGTAQHVAEKYSQLARDAQASGDPVAAENYFQHAEHYFRIIAAAQEQLREQFGYQQRFDDDGDEEGFPGTGPRQRRRWRFRQPAAALRRRRPLRAARTPGPARADRRGRTGRGRIGSRTAPSGRTDQPDRRERFQRDRPPRQDFQRDDRVDRPSVRIANRSARSASRGRSVRSGASSGASAAIRPKRPRAMPAACRPS